MCFSCDVRLDSPLGSGSDAIKGCSPVVCAALAGSVDALGALQSHMGPRAFAYACRAQGICVCHFMLIYVCTRVLYSDVRCCIYFLFQMPTA